MNNRHSLSDE